MLLIYVFLLLLLGFISLGCSSVFGFWVLNEVSSFFVILGIMYPFGSFTKSLVSLFLIQSFSGILLLNFTLYVFSCLGSKPLEGLISLLLCLVLFMKLGLFPFHLWYLYLFKGFDWMGILFLLTVSKIIPITIISCFDFLGFWSFLFSSISSAVGAFMGICEASLKGALACSSLVHTSWILFCWFIDLSVGLGYIVFYLFVTWIVFMMFDFGGLEFFHSLISFSGYHVSMFFVFLVFCMSGIPPLAFFWFKLILLNAYVKSFWWAWGGVLVASSVISVIFYVRLSLLSLLGYFSILKVNSLFHFSFYSFVFSLFFGMFLIPLF